MFSSLKMCKFTTFHFLKLSRLLKCFKKIFKLLNFEVTVYTCINTFLGLNFWKFSNFTRLKFSQIVKVFHNSTLNSSFRIYENKVIIHLCRYKNQTKNYSSRFRYLNSNSLFKLKIVKSGVKL